jgi:hypothetical protein
MGLNGHSIRYQQTGQGVFSEVSMGANEYGYQLRAYLYLKPSTSAADPESSQFTSSQGFTRLSTAGSPGAAESAVSGIQAAPRNASGPAEGGTTPKTGDDTKEIARRILGQAQTSGLRVTLKHLVADILQKDLDNVKVVKSLPACPVEGVYVIPKTNFAKSTRSGKQDIFHVACMRRSGLGNPKSQNGTQKSQQRTESQGTTNDSEQTQDNDSQETRETLSEKWSEQPSESKVTITNWKCISGYECLTIGCGNKTNWSYHGKEAKADGSNIVCGACAGGTRPYTTDNKRCPYEWYTMRVEGETVGLVVVPAFIHNHEVRPEEQCTSEEALHTVTRIAIEQVEKGKGRGLETLKQNVQMSIDKNLREGAFDFIIF